MNTQSKQEEPSLYIHEEPSLYIHGNRLDILRKSLLDEHEQTLESQYIMSFYYDSFRVLEIRNRMYVLPPLK